MLITLRILFLYVVIISTLYILLQVIHRNAALAAETTPVYADDMGTASTQKATAKSARAAKKAAKSSNTVQRRVNLRKLLLAYAALVVISAVCALIAVHNQNKHTLADPFPAAQRQAVKVQLYYPSRLPDGYQFDIASAESVENTVVVLRATNPDQGTEFSISQQAAPDNFNYNILYNSFEGKTSFKSKLGQVTSGTIDNGQTRIASLVTKDNTWILINAKAGVSLDEMRIVMNSLKPSGKSQ